MPMKSGVYVIIAFVQRDGSVGQMENLKPDKRLPLFPLVMAPEAA